MSLLKKKVTFSDVVTYYDIPGHEEDRRGTWKCDSDRFLMRVKIFEKEYLKKLDEAVQLSFQKKVTDSTSDI